MDENPEAKAKLEAYKEWVKHNPHRHGYQPKDLSRLVSVWGTVSQTALCERFNISRATLLTHAKRLGLPLRSRGSFDSNASRQRSRHRRLRHLQREPLLPSRDAKLRSP